MSNGLSQYIMPLSQTMKDNIDTILNTSYLVGADPHHTGIKITDRPHTAIQHIDLTFTGINIVTGEDYTLKPLELTYFDIVQNFETDICDYVSITCTFPPDDLITLLDNYRNLMCTITMHPINAVTNHMNTDELTYTRKFRAIFKDKELRKRLSKEALIPDKPSDKGREHFDQLYTKIEFQLMEEPIYLLRKRKFNFQLRDATVKDAILFLCQICEINSVSLKEPDNKTKYKHIIIPPMMTFHECLTHLQSYYGVYSAGMACYFTGDILYIYPPYETNMTSDTTNGTHLYNAGPGGFMGNNVYHAYSDDIAHIIINSHVYVKELVDQGVEMFGNAILYQHANNVIDKFAIVTNPESQALAPIGFGPIVFNETNTSMMMFEKDDTGIMDNVYTPTYKFDNANMFYCQSELSAYRRSLFGMTWTQAIPDMFKPGYTVHYHYDGEDLTRREQGVATGKSTTYLTRTGMCHSAKYTFTPISGLTANGTYCYGGKCELMLSMSYQAATTQPVADIDNDTVQQNATNNVSSKNDGKSTESKGSYTPGIF